MKDFYEMYDLIKEAHEADLDMHSHKDLHGEMVKFLKAHFHDADDFDIEGAIKWFACDHHEGQASDLYAICSSSEYKPGRMTNSIEDENETMQHLYDLLVSHFS